MLNFKVLGTDWDGGRTLAPYLQQLKDDVTPVYESSTVLSDLSLERI